MNREATYAFFGQHVLGLGDDPKLKERAISMEKLQDMMVLHDRSFPAGALTFPQIFEQWVKMSGEQTGDSRTRLTAALAAEWPERVVSESSGEKVVLGRSERGDRIPGIFVKGSEPAALVVSADGAEAARREPEVQKLLTAGRSVLLIDAFQTGSAVAPRDQSVKMFLTFNKTNDANRVQDILTALSWLHAAGTAEPELDCAGRAGVWCEFAAAVSPIRVNLHADLSSFHGTDEEFVNEFFVPGIQRAGGLRAALALTQ